jgi:hypothetical protein
MGKTEGPQVPFFERDVRESEGLLDLVDVVSGPERAARRRRGAYADKFSALSLPLPNLCTQRGCTLLPD